MRWLLFLTNYLFILGNMPYTAEQIPDEHYIYRRVRKQHIHPITGKPDLAAFDDNNNEMSVDWCKYNGCIVQCSPRTNGCMEEKESWEETRQRVPVCVFFTALQRRHQGLTKELAKKYFAFSKKDPDLVEIRRVRDEKKINRSLSLSAAEKQMLLTIIQEVPQQWDVIGACVGKVRAVPLPVRHQPTQNRAHSVVLQSSFPPNSTEREDMLEELAKCFKLLK